MSEEIPITQPGGTPGGTVPVVPVVDAPKPWLEQIETSLRGHEALKDVTDVNHLTKTYITQREENASLKGKLETSIKLPGKDAKPEEMAAYRKAMEVPDKPEDYKLEKPQLPEGLPYDDSIEGWFKQTMHENNVAQSAVQKVFSGYINLMSEQYNAIQQHNKQYVDDLMLDVKKEWGADYAVNDELAKRGQKLLTDTATDSKFKEWLGKYAPEKNPMLYRLFSLVGKNAQGTAFVQGQSGGTGKKGGFEYPNTPKI